ncbi:hypothetical protein BGX24_000113 [Mortierella sp. AD032]|nr:hypothetical protein BGX24_000113 [Mortierella sp. AD032]
MTVSNLGVVFAPTLSMGSVLFKALLGGFYDGADTPENREKGLKIVWGGLLQDMGYETLNWTDEDDHDDPGESGLRSGDKAELGDKAEFGDKAELLDPPSPSQPPYYQEQPQHWIRHQQSLPTMSPYTGHYTNGIGPLDLSPPASRITSNHARNDSDEESMLMQEMLLKEAMATTNETAEISLPPYGQDFTVTSTVDNTQPPSHTTSTAAAVPNQLTTSSTISSAPQDGGDHDVSPTVAIPIANFDNPLAPHIITSTAGDTTHTLSQSVSKVTPPSSPLDDPAVLRSPSGAPQLPMFDSISAL